MAIYSEIHPDMVERFHISPFCRLSKPCGHWCKITLSDGRNRGGHLDADHIQYLINFIAKEKVFSSPEPEESPNYATLMELPHLISQLDSSNTDESEAIIGKQEDSKPEFPKEEAQSKIQELIDKSGVSLAITILNTFFSNDSCNILFPAQYKLGPSVPRNQKRTQKIAELKEKHQAERLQRALQSSQQDS